MKTKSLYEKIEQGETTVRDAAKFRLIQISTILLGIALILSWIIK